jgi:hypothetical protein
MNADPAFASATADPSAGADELPYSAGEAGGRPAELPADPQADAAIETDSPEGYQPV